jgi:methionyl-tRNA synthetase
MKRALITATPPTPNGDLHVGHLSGPYLAGDVFKRFRRLQGGETCYVTGGDDNQSYVATKARQLAMTPEAVAERFDDAIEETLRRAQIEVDVYVRPLRSSRHARFVSDFVARLHAGGKLVVKQSDAAWCGQCERYLFEAYLGGVCPHCGEHSDGSVCESCARPNQCTDMIDAACKECGSPALRRPCKRLFFPLAPYTRRLADYFGRVAMGPHLAAVCEAMLAQGLPDIPISNPADWGIPVPVPGFAGQRLYAWFEMAPGYLSATAEALAGRARPAGAPGTPETPEPSETPETPENAAWQDWWRSDDAEVVQFFGHDNSYFHAILFTAEMMAFDPEIRLPAAFVTNEFYRLDGLKFSTSRSHAIWGRQALDQLSPDLLRYYLCLDRPEAEQTNFRLADFRAAATRELVAGWEAWLLALGRKVHGELGGRAPEPAAAGPSQARFAAETAELLASAEQAYQAASFSPHRVVTALNRLVHAANAFGAAESHWRSGAARERRRAAALELSAAATLAVAAAPIMPGFAARLRSELGFAPLGPGDWPARPVVVPAGQRLHGMESPYFQGIDAACDALEAARRPPGAKAAA